MAKFPQKILPQAKALNNKPASFIGPVRPGQTIGGVVLLQGLPVIELNKWPGLHSVGVVIVLQRSPVSRLNKSPGKQSPTEEFCAFIKLTFKSPKIKAKTNRNTMYFFILYIYCITPKPLVNPSVDKTPWLRHPAIISGLRPCFYRVQ